MIGLPLHQYYLSINNAVSVEKRQSEQEDALWISVGGRAKGRSMGGVGV